MAAFVLSCKNHGWCLLDHSSSSCFVPMVFPLLSPRSSGGFRGGLFGS